MDVFQTLNSPFHSNFHLFTTVSTAPSGFCNGLPVSESFLYRVINLLARFQKIVSLAKLGDFHDNQRLNVHHGWNAHHGSLFSNYTAYVLKRSDIEIYYFEFLGLWRNAFRPVQHMSFKVKWPMLLLDLLIFLCTWYFFALLSGQKLTLGCQTRRSIYFKRNKGLARQ